MQAFMNLPPESIRDKLNKFSKVDATIVLTN